MIDWINLGLEITSIILAVGSILFVIYLLDKLAGINEKKKVDTYICPKCGSLNIIHEKKGPTDTYFIASLKSTNFFNCIDCGYKGECPIILKSEVIQFQKEIKDSKNNKNKTSKKIIKNSKKEKK